MDFDVLYFGFITTHKYNPLIYYKGCKFYPVN